MNMSGYTKLFSSILDSTIWQAPNHVRIVWITMLAMKDRDGIVEAAVPGLAHRARVSVDEVESALAMLLGPDPYSRTPDNEGRRIETIKGGWRVLNADSYRDKMGIEERREKDAIRQRRVRERRMAGHATSRVTRDLSLHADTDSKADTEKDHGLAASEFTSGDHCQHRRATTGGECEGNHSVPVTSLVTDVTLRESKPAAPAKSTTRKRANPEAGFTPEELATVDVVLEKLGKRKRPPTQYQRSLPHTRLIVRHLRDGYSERDLRIVTGFCAEQLGWAGDPRMEKFLRPETLFGPETMHKYIADARAWAATLPPHLLPPESPKQLELDADVQLALKAGSDES